MTHRDAAWLASRVFLGIAVCCAVYRLFFLAVSSSAAGIVTDLIPQESTESDHLAHRAAFTFETVDGDVVHGAAGWASSPAGFDVGEQIRVRYLSFAPSWAVIDTPIQLWLTTMFFGGMGCAFWVFHVVMAKVRGMMPSRSRR
jgi:hypothetical protein